MPALEEDEEQEFVTLPVRSGSRSSEKKKAEHSPPEAVEERRPLRGKLLLSLVMLLAIVLAVGGLYFRSRSSFGLTGKDTLLLADFENKTGDAIFDGTLMQGLAVQLGQTPFLNFLAGPQV
jgi:hypothetical protein